MGARREEGGGLESKRRDAPHMHARRRFRYRSGDRGETFRQGAVSCVRAVRAPLVRSRRVQAQHAVLLAGVERVARLRRSWEIKGERGRYG